MGLLDRIGNGIGRVCDAIDEGWEKRGLAGVVGYGASAMAGEAFVQPLAAGMSLIGKGDAIEQSYQGKFEETIAEVARHDNSHTKALFSFVGSGIDNTLGLLGESGGHVAKKVEEII